MALGEASAHSTYYYHNIMQHSKNDQGKLNAVDRTNEMNSAEKSPSMLYAMQSVFREKIAMKMNHEKHNGRAKHKRMEHENSLLELCEKRQNMVKKYSESYKENNRKDATSGTTNRIKKLPPITTIQNNDSPYKGHDGVPVTNGDSTSKKPFSKSTTNFATNMNSNYSSANSAMHKSAPLNQKASNDQKTHAQERKLEESPPDVSKLRLVRNKRKHELLKLNTKHAPTKNLLTDEEQPLSSFHKNQTKRNKEKQSAISKHGGKSDTVPASFQQPHSDFQKWQAEQDREREERLARHQNLPKQRAINEQPHKPSNYLRRRIGANLHDAKSFSPKITHKNEKKKSLHQRPTSPGPHVHTDADFPVHPSNHTRENVYSKSVVNPPDKRGTPLNRKTHDSPLMYSNAVMPGLQKPVLVRHDGRSNNSSRTSTRNTFYSQTKMIPPMEGERDALEKLPSSDSAWNNEKDRVLVNYETASIPEQDDIDLVPCQICGRKFRVERIKKHIAVCSKASNKKRRVFNMTRARKKGTEMEKFTASKTASSFAVQQHPRKSNWRSQHEDFIKTIRHAKIVTNYVKEGGNLADLPPPEPSQNPDYVTCDFCQRRFAPKVAERHIPRCKDIRARPAPPKSKFQRNKR